MVSTDNKKKKGRWFFKLVHFYVETFSMYAGEVI
jgi:hypothetical protein